jgi:hypothetical protein
MLCVTQVFAQNRTVSGTVVAKDDGLPIPGATVKVKGTTTLVPKPLQPVNSPYRFRPALLLCFHFLVTSLQRLKLAASDVINVSLRVIFKRNW